MTKTSISNIYDVVTTLSLYHIEENSIELNTTALRNHCDRSMLDKLMTLLDKLDNIQHNTRPCEVGFYFLTWSKSLDDLLLNLCKFHNVTDENAVIVLVYHDRIKFYHV